MTYIIRYYDIGWNVHTARINADSIQNAVAQLLAACVCVRSEIITYYEETTK